MIEVKSNAGDFMAAIDAMLTQVDEIASDGFYNWTLRPFYDLAMNTPQWSGDLASNWMYSVNGPSSAYEQLGYKHLAWPPNPEFPPFQRGSTLAVSGALGRAEHTPRPSYKDRVFFTNNTPIAFDVENQIVNLRPINLIGGVVAMASFTAFKWKNIPYDATKFTFA